MILVLAKRWIKFLVICLVMCIFVSGCAWPGMLSSENVEESSGETKGNISRIAQAGTCQGTDEGENKRKQREKFAKDKEEPSGVRTLTVAAVGDIMVHSPQIRSAKQPDGTYDFKSVFEEVKPYLESCDIAICNLETTISTPEKGYGGYPRFRAPEAIVEALKYAGFDVVTTANNHSLDGKEFGIIRTIEALDKYGLFHTGTARSSQERDKILLIEKNDIKIAVLAYTYGTNGMEAAVDKNKLSYLVNYYGDMDSVKRDIKRAREAGADVVIVCMHWGVEYTREPIESQKRLADEIFTAGADIILGSHPHVLQPMEKKKITDVDGKERDVFVIYSLGNFISNQRERYRDSGVILEIKIAKDCDRDTVKLEEISYLPTWVYKFIRNGKAHYRILPLTSSIGREAEGEAGRRIKEVWNETTALYGEEFSVVGE